MTKGTRKKRTAYAWVPAFIATLRNTCNVRASCQAAGIARSKAYDHRDADKAFAKEWADAIEDGIEVLEAAARQRALGTSDTLMIFLLKAHRPEVYRERHEVRIDYTALRSEAERIARENGLPVEDVVAEAERIAKGLA
jgi:hypothetical protein